MNEPTPTTAGARTQLPTASGTVEQGRRPMYRSHETQAAINRMIVNKLTKSVLAAWRANGRKPQQ